MTRRPAPAASWLPPANICATTIPHFLSEEEHAKNNLPDVLMRWEERNGAEKDRSRTAQSFCVPKAEIAATGGYDLSLNRYKEVEHERQNHAAPADIIRELRTLALEKEITSGLTKLEEMLG